MRLQPGKIAPILVICSLASGAFAAGGPLGIDHRLPLDESGIWNRSNQTAVQNLSALTVIGGALVEGNDTRLGRAFWKATESMVIADLSAGALNAATGRPRPVQLNDSNQWSRSGGGYRSFPSGEVTHITSIVTPFIVECGHDHLAVWSLAALPVYIGTARLKAQAHWQTDVLAGAALGAGIGYYESARESA